MAAVKKQKNKDKSVHETFEHKDLDYDLFSDDSETYFDAGDSDDSSEYSSSSYRTPVEVNHVAPFLPHEHTFEYQKLSKINENVQIISNGNTTSDPITPLSTMQDVDTNILNIFDAIAEDHPSIFEIESPKNVIIKETVNVNEQKQESKETENNNNDQTLNIANTNHKKDILPIKTFISNKKSRSKSRSQLRALRTPIPVPRLGENVVFDDDGSETIVQIRFVHFVARVRTHPRLNHFRIINYASKSYRKDPKQILAVLDKQSSLKERGYLDVDGACYAFVRKHIGKQKEYKMALRTNSDDKIMASTLLDFFEAKLDERLANVSKISKFNHNQCFQTVIAKLQANAK